MKITDLINHYNIVVKISELTTQQITEKQETIIEQVNQIYNFFSKNKVEDNKKNSTLEQKEVTLTDLNEIDTLKIEITAIKTILKRQLQGFKFQKNEKQEITPDQLRKILIDSIDKSIKNKEWEECFRLITELSFVTSTISLYEWDDMFIDIFKGILLDKDFDKEEQWNLINKIFLLNQFSPCPFTVYNIIEEIAIVLVEGNQIEMAARLVAEFYIDDEITHIDIANIVCGLVDIDDQTKTIMATTEFCRQLIRRLADDSKSLLTVVIKQLCKNEHTPFAAKLFKQLSNATVDKTVYEDLCLISERFLFEKDYRYEKVDEDSEINDVIEDEIDEDESTNDEDEDWDMFLLWIKETQKVYNNELSFQELTQRQIKKMTLAAINDDSDSLVKYNHLVDWINLTCEVKNMGYRLALKLISEAFEENNHKRLIKEITNFYICVGATNETSDIVTFVENLDSTTQAQTISAFCLYFYNIDSESLSRLNFTIIQHLVDENKFELMKIWLTHSCDTIAKEQHVLIIYKCFVHIFNNQINNLGLKPEKITDFHITNALQNIIKIVYSLGLPKTVCMYISASLVSMIERYLNKADYIKHYIKDESLFQLMQKICRKINDADFQGTVSTIKKLEQNLPLFLIMLTINYCNFNQKGVIAKYLSFVFSEITTN